MCVCVRACVRAGVCVCVRVRGDGRTGRRGAGEAPRHCGRRRSGGWSRTRQAVMVLCVCVSVCVCVCWGRVSGLVMVLW